MRRIVLGLFLAPLVAIGAHGVVAGPVEPDREVTAAADPFVNANSSRCVTVPGASPGDIAVVNITNTQASGPGYGALRASGTTPVYQRATSAQFSSVNFASSTPPNPNLAFTKIGADNKFCYDGAVSNHHVILDLAATIPAANIDAIDPTRILDTRSQSRVNANSSRCVTVPGASPGDIAVVNITNTQASGPGYGALRASGTTPVYQRATSAQFSSVNFASSTPPNPNLAFTKIGADNKFCYDGAVSNHHVILDLAATIPAANIDAIDPTRILDTRSQSRVNANSSRCVTVPGASPGDIAVVNITNTQASGPGYGALRASGTTPVYQRATSAQFSSVNFASSTPPNPNLAFTKIGADNKFCYDGAVSNHHVILDLAATIPAANIDAIDPTRILDTRSEGDPSPPPPGDGSLRFVAGVSSRSLVDQQGDSLYLVADAGWSLIGVLDRAEIERYLDLLVQRKHNAVLFNMIENGFSANPPTAGEPGAGNPFSGAMFSSSPNEAYWSHVDWVISEMEQRGLTAIANPVYAGFIDQHGVGAQMVSSTNQQMRAFGEFIGNRYKNRINIVYQIGGDRNFDPTSTLGDRYNAFADGLRSRDASTVMTVMTGPDNYSSAMWNPNWLDFEAVYENDSGDLGLLDVWDSTSKPLIYAEPAYEGARWPDTGWSRLYGRRQLYVSFGNGYSGIIPGNCLRWHFEQDPQGVGCSSWGNANWDETLLDPSGNTGPGGQRADQHATDTQRFTELVATLPWPSMLPDTNNQFLTNGNGNGTDRAAARLGNQTGFVYLPNARNITIDTTRIAPRVALHWHDPTTTNTITITTNEAATTNRTIQHPGPNNTGDNDWILITQPAT